MYCWGGHSSKALIRVGRHSREREDIMTAMAEGVKGLLIMRRDSWVVRALSIAEASERSWRGFAELESVLGG